MQISEKPQKGHFAFVFFTFTFGYFSFTFVLQAFNSVQAFIQLLGNEVNKRIRTRHKMPLHPLQQQGVMLLQHLRILTFHGQIAHLATVARHVIEQFAVLPGFVSGQIGSPSPRRAVGAGSVATLHQRRKLTLFALSGSLAHTHSSAHPHRREPRRNWQIDWDSLPVAILQGQRTECSAYGHTRKYYAGCRTKPRGRTARCVSVAGSPPMPLPVVVVIPIAGSQNRKRVRRAGNWC